MHRANLLTSQNNSHLKTYELGMMSSFYPALRKMENFPKACSASVRLAIYKMRCFLQNARISIDKEKKSIADT